MIKKILLFSLLVLGIESKAQVGINTTTPNAQLDVQSSNQSTPSNTDGILIPKVDVFPATNPTFAQQGMLLYLTTATTFSGNPKPIGFYYWNNTPPDWIAIQGTDGGTLDQAYDFGGPGNGGTITADTGAVLINGTDGLVSTGTSGTGVVAPSGAGTRMVWNPRKTAFRAGIVTGTQWDDTNIGSTSVAFGLNTTASGSLSFAFGNNSTSSGNLSTSFGLSNTASGSTSFAFGNGSTASGNTSFAFGNNTIASGSFSTGFGRFSNSLGDNTFVAGLNNFANSFGEVVVGIGATTYTPSANGATQFRTANSNDRLFVVGNAIDTNNNNTVDLAERSNAMVVLKNGATGIGTSLPNAVLDINANDHGILIPRVALNSKIVQAPVVNPLGGILPVSTMIYNTATAGVSPNNVYPGFYYWNTTNWVRFDANGENNPTYYTAVGTFDTFSSSTFFSLPQMSVTFTPKDDVVLVNFSAAGNRFDDACADTAIFFQIVLNGIPVTGWQTASKQSIVDSSFFDDDITTWDTNISYPVSVPIGIPQTIQIQWSAPDCTMINHPSTTFSAFGSVFRSYRTLTVIDPNGGGGIVGTPPVTTNLWALNGNTGTNALTNFLGTADSQPLRFRTGNTFAGNISNTATGLVGLGLNAGPVNTGFSNTFFGGTAGLLNTTGDSNTFIGQGAGASNTTTSSNTYVGTGAGQSNTTGSQNVYLGRLAGGNGATGSNNILIGNGAGILNQANQNSFVGSFSGNGNSTGANNSFFGFSSGASNGIGNQNTFVGAFAGNVNTDGTLNTIIGCNANLSTNNLTNAAAIGTNALVSASNSLVLGSVNGVNSATSTVNVGIGTTAPLERLHVAGRTFLTNGFSADNAALVYRNNTDYMFLGPQSGSSANGAAMALFGTTNSTGGNAGGVDFNVPTGLVRITSAGNVGIGATPARKLEVSNAGIVYGRITNTASTEVGFELKRLGSDWQMRNEAGLLFFGQSSDDLVTVNDVLRLAGSSVTPAVDNGITLGQLGLRWTNVFAVNGTIQTSDANDKKEMKPITFGLDKIKQLRPISFQWKDNAIDNSATHLGFVAQEVKQVLPQVIVDSDWVELPEGQGRVWQKSERLGMKYAEIIPVLVKAVQEQQEVIENQKNEIKTLKQQLEQQQRAILERLEKLEATSKPD